MARKDVDLIVRARDEAGKVLDNLTSAFNSFVTAQGDLKDSSTKTESVLGKLGAAVTGLDKAVSGLDLGRKLSADVNRAAASLTKLETETASTREELTKLNQSASGAAANVARLTQKLEGAADAQRKQKTVVRDAVKAQSELAVVYRETERAQEKLVSRQTKLPELIQKQAAAVDQAAARFAELSDEMRGTEKPSESLQKAVFSANAALARQQERLGALRAEYATIGPQVRAAGSAMAFLSGESAAAAANVDKQRAVLGAVAANYGKLEGETKSAVAAQNSAATAISKTTSALARQEGEIKRAATEFANLNANAARVDDVTVQFTAQAKGGLEQQLVDQGIAAQRAREEMLDLEAAVSGLKHEIGAVGVPTREMAAELALTAQRADEAQLKFMLQEETLGRLGIAYREMGADLASVAAVQDKFVAEQQMLSKAMKDVSQDGLRERTAIRSLHTETERAAASSGRLATESQRNADAMRRAAQETGGLAEAYRKLYGDTRQSLSLTQRLRGEVLSLVAAYGGFYGVISLLGQVVEAYQTLEAANARLNVATGGDVQRTAEEMDFLRRTADRLGIDLGTLSTEYSKFAISTKGTNLAGANTRKIFLAVAEAAVVSRVSTAELSGTFVALSQIVSKGAVQMEELRQQLGDRLPGALQIMADGLNVTTGELIKMMEQGQVSADALVPFAEELNKRFGPGLGEALAGTTVGLGRLKNAAFQAMVQFASSGFIDSFNALLKDLTATLQSADFEAFITRLSGATAVLSDTLGIVVRNFDLVAAAAGAFVGLKLLGALSAMVGGFGQTAQQAKLAAAGITIAGTAATATGVNAAGAAVKVGRLTGAIRTLMSSSGLGLLVVGGATLFGYMSTQADLATEALSKHRDLLDIVKQKYDDVSGSVDGWRANLENLTVQEATKSLEDLTASLEDAKDALDNANFSDGESFFAQAIPFASYFTGASAEYNEAVQAVIDSFKSGAIDAKELRSQIDAVNTKFRDGSSEHARYADSLDQATKRILELTYGVEEAQKIITALTGTTDEAKAALDDLAGSSETFSQTFEQNAVGAVTAFDKAMADLKDEMPKLRDEMDKFGATVDGIETAFQAALKAARAMPDAIMRIAAEQQALATANEAIRRAAQGFVDQEFGSFTDGTEATAALLRQSEGFRETPYWDVNAFRVGFGSDTVTLADGTIKKVVEGMSVSVADANRDLMRRITTEFMPLAREGSGGRFDGFTAQQQAALTSIAYNYGELPDRLAKVIQGGGTIEEIAQAIEGLGGDNNGINQGRRAQEAALFRSSAGIEPAVKEQMKADEEARKALEKAAEEEAKRRAKTAETIADGEAELAQQKLINAGKEREAEIEDAIREAKKDDPNITEAELQAIREQTGAVFDLKKAKEESKTVSEEAKEAEEKINQLMAQRDALQDQIGFALKAGDTQQADALRVKMAEINAQLLAAIENAKQMWLAVGGTEADAATAKLEVARLSAEAFGKAGVQVYLDWTRVKDLVIDGLAGAFDSFSQQVAEGVPPLEAARNAFLQFASDFLIQIAQMILKQALFNAISGAIGGTSFGAAIGFGAPTAHSGGVVGSKRVGSGNAVRQVNPMVFASALRFHNGGLPGLAANEVPTILKKGEEVLTEDDPRNILNGGGQQGGSAAAQRQMKIVNKIEPRDVAAAIFDDEDGSEVFVNWFRVNRTTVRAILGS